MENNTGKNGVTFSVGANSKETVKEGNIKPEIISSPVKESDSENKNIPVSGSVEEKNRSILDKEYVDKRSVTIALVHNYSLYRKTNSKVMPKRRDFIGSSIRSSRTLTANESEVNTYFPKLIGLSPNNENFITRVKQYLNNIQIPINELGKKFDISFHYNRYADYKMIKAKEEAIDAKYRSANKQDIRDLKKALNAKIEAINELESSKHKLGYPINIDDYLMYRHCLLFNEVAKDTAIINSDSSIRFYFRDDQKEAENQRKLRFEINKAKANYVTMLADDELFDAIYSQYCVYSGKSVILSSLSDRVDKEAELDKFSTNEPIKFNKFFNDNDIKLKSIIEILIERGEFVRAQYSQNITTQDGEFIGSNMKEAITWFKNPNNANVVKAYINKIKNS